MRSLILGKGAGGKCIVSEEMRKFSSWISNFKLLLLDGQLEMSIFYFIPFLTKGSPLHTHVHMAVGWHTWNWLQGSALKKNKCWQTQTCKCWTECFSVLSGLQHPLPKKVRKRPWTVHYKSCLNLWKWSCTLTCNRSFVFLMYFSLLHITRTLCSLIAIGTCAILECYVDKIMAVFSLIIDYEI